VPTISVKGERRDDEQLAVDRQDLRPAPGVHLQNGGMLSVGSRIVCLGPGRDGAARPPEFGLIA